MAKTRTAENTFDGLGEEEQLAIVRRLCGQRGKRLVRKFGAYAIGAGYKKTAGRVLPTICIGFLVDAKSESPARPVPHEITTYVRRGGRRIRCQVPTDVEEIGAGHPQKMQNLANGIHSSAAANAALSLRGAACCIVAQTDKPANRFLLGCQHVLALSLLGRQCGCIDSVIRANGSPEVVARLYEYAELTPSGKPCLDAAIALANPAAKIFWDAGRIVPQRVEPGVNRPLDCTIFTPRGPRPARFVKEWANVRLPYPSCGMVTIAAAYQFVADTAAGDSGSPLIDRQGTLHGMHFWGDPGQQLAFAIPAFMLFQPGLFSIEIALAS
ncbi:trypsin-like serine protease [Massilia suwonensis]|uniref:Trypsin-like serine protease n=1 Tax=Massilia suwonensis TaxID=648895 RepID=A0ABW0MKY5_9BURK